MDACTWWRQDCEAVAAGRPRRRSWFSTSVLGIGGASVLSDVAHEISTALLPGVLAGLGAPAAALALIEGAGSGALGATKLIGGPACDAPSVRRPLTAVSYALSAIFSALIGLGGTPLQAGAFRTLEMASKGLQVAARNALVADLVDAGAYGRAYGLKRVFDSLGAILGLSVVLTLLSRLTVREALMTAAVPGLLAAIAVLLTVRPSDAPPAPRRRVPRAYLLSFPVRRLFGPIAAIQLGVAAASLPILHAAQVLAPALGARAATQAAVGVYMLYKIAAAAIGVPAGFVIDRLGYKPIFVCGALLVAAADLAYARALPSAQLLGFLAAGLGVGCLETAQSTAVAMAVPPSLRGSAFGMLAAVQNFGVVVASVAAGLLWTLWSPAAAFLCLGAAAGLGAVASVACLPGRSRAAAALPTTPAPRPAFRRRSPAGLPC